MAATFSHDVMNSHVFVIGKFGLGSNEAIKHPDMDRYAKKDELSIKKVYIDCNKKEEAFNYNCSESPLIGNTYCIELTPDDSKLIATSFLGGSENMDHVRIHVITTKDKQLIYSLENPRSSRITSIAIDQESNRFFASHWNSGVKAYNIREPLTAGRSELGDFEREYPTGDSRPKIHSLDISTDDRFLIVSNRNIVRVFMLKSVHSDPITYSELRETVTCVKADRNPQFFYATTKRGTVYKFLISGYSFSGSEN